MSTPLRKIFSTGFMVYLIIPIDIRSGVCFNARVPDNPGEQKAHNET